MRGKKLRLLLADIVVLGAALLIFGVPLYFLVINSFKDQKAARQLSISWPESFPIA